jgi:hypothetical protein
LTDAVDIIGTLAHELVHATMESGVGHGRPFKRCALAIGLRGPMRATTAGPAFAAWTDELLQKIGPYPAGFLTDSPKQGTRMLRCQCTACGYIARVSRRWLDQAGAPICPTDRIAMATVEVVKGTPVPPQQAATERVGEAA